MKKAKLELINIKEDVIATSYRVDNCLDSNLSFDISKKSFFYDSGNTVKSSDETPEILCSASGQNKVNGVNKGSTSGANVFDSGYYYHYVNSSKTGENQYSEWIVCNSHSGDGEDNHYCLSKGTKITMSDNSIKNIEDIKEGDVVLTYNHEKGEYEGQKIYLVYKSEEPKCPFTLHFTNGINISVIGDHNFFEKESLTYASIFESNAESFIGKHFYNSIKNRYEELLSVTHEKEAVDYYEIYSEYNANCIAENMLNCPNDACEVLNIYKFNEDLTIDHNQLEKDIKEFGLHEYPKDANYSKEIFDKLCWKYVNLIIGKGFGTMDEFIARKEDFLENFNNG